MSSPFTIKYCLSPTQKKKIPKNLRVKLIVCWNDSSLHTNEYYYCLHCQGLFSRSGHHYHKQNIVATEQMIDQWVTDFFIDQESHHTFIRSQFETRFVMGRLKGRMVFETDPIDVFVPINPQRAERAQPPAHVSNPPAPRPEHVLLPLEPDMYQQPTGRENDEIINNFPELFDCFSSEGFNLEQFKLFARNFLRNRPERTDKKRVGQI